MHPVKVADGYKRPTGPGGEFLRVFDRDHRHPAPSDRPVFPEQPVTS
jgi:hypothetical protein